jgi:hypothetical protein
MADLNSEAERLILVQPSALFVKFPMVAKIARLVVFGTPCFPDVVCGVCESASPCSWPVKGHNKDGSRPRRPRLAAKYEPLAFASVSVKGKPEN